MYGDVCSLIQCCACVSLSLIILLKYILLYHSYKDVTETTFEVLYETDDAGGNRVRRRQEILNLRDGLILHQFRVFGNYQSLTISVTYRGKQVADSPYRVGPVLHEDCACPLRSLDEWMSDFGCPETDPQIIEDLEPFRKDGVNVTNLYERGGEMFPRNSFIHYSIVDSKVFIHCHVVSYII